MAKDKSDILSDFRPEGETRVGSQNGLLFKARKNGKLYCIKFHRVFMRPEQPVWDSENDFDKKNYRRACARAEKLQAGFDQYYDYKNRLYTAARAGERLSNVINCPSYFWKQRGSKEQCDGKITCMEAVPWLTKVADIEATDGCPALRDLNEDTIRTVILSFARSIALLHSRGVVHSDIKPANMVITKSRKGEYQGCLIDFDMCFFEAEKPPLSIRRCIMGGTDEYKAPEMICFDASLSDEEFDYSQMSYPIDIFAFGVSIFQYLDSKSCVPLADRKEEIYKRCVGQALFDGIKTDLMRAEQEDILSDFWVAVIGWCLAADPKQRPTAQQLVDALTVGKASAVPVQYRRFDPDSPWKTDNVFNDRLCEANGISIAKAEEAEGCYNVTKGSVSLRMTEEQLVASQLELAPNQRFASEKYLSSAGEVLPWEDGVRLNISQKYQVQRGERYGEYIVRQDNFERKLDLQALISLGLADYIDEELSEEDSTPWQEDCIEFCGNAVRRGNKPGQYKIIGKKTESVTADDLLNSGRAKRTLYECRKPLTTDISFVNPEDKIFQAKDKGFYVVVGAACYKADKQGLISNGLATSIAPTKKTRAIVDDRVWEGDNIRITTELPVKKAKRAGMYEVNSNGMLRFYSAERMVTMGYAESTEQPESTESGLYESMELSAAVKAILGEAEDSIESISELLLEIDSRERALAAKRCARERRALEEAEREKLNERKRELEQAENSRRELAAAETQRLRDLRLESLREGWKQMEKECDKKKAALMPKPIEPPEKSKRLVREVCTMQCLSLQSSVAELEDYVKVNDPLRRKKRIKLFFKIVKWVFLSACAVLDVLGVLTLIMFLISIFS